MDTTPAPTAVELPLWLCELVWEADGTPVGDLAVVAEAAALVNRPWGAATSNAPEPTTYAPGEWVVPLADYAPTALARDARVRTGAGVVLVDVVDLA